MPIIRHTNARLNGTRELSLIDADIEPDLGNNTGSLLSALSANRGWFRTCLHSLLLSRGS